jgi:dTDP-4-dehydrorhamnose 3,5-epimerase
MNFVPTVLLDTFIIAPELRADERGWFARTWCQQEAAAHGLSPTWVQHNLSFNRTCGTVRGLHYQTAPAAESKLVRCTRGALYDVVLDVRPASPTYRRWVAVELTADNRLLLYVPEGCAHGFQTLADNTEVAYHMSAVYTPGCARGVRWNDPAFGIRWPLPVTVMADRDAQYPDFIISMGGVS